MPGRRMLSSGCGECTDTLPRQQRRGGPGEGGQIFVAWGHRLSVKLKVESGKRERRGDPCGRPGARRTDCHDQRSRWSRNDMTFYKGCGGAGRCGERTERCQWQRKRSERVAAVKILSVRRKAAQKFWAPQQDHRPLRVHNKRRGTAGGQRRPPLRRSRKFCEQLAGHLFSVCTQILLCACYNERMCFYSFP